MAFAAFEKAISAEPLRRVARHWHEVRGGRKVPYWEDIRPSAIAVHLPILWSWRYDAGTDSFTGRLAGDAIEAVFAKSFRGTAMADIFPAAEYPGIFERHKRVMAEPALFHGTGLVFRHIERYGVGERIILPLADGIVGATIYDAMSGDLPPALEAAGEAEEWFALD